MSKQTIGQKAGRVLLFLLGLRVPAVATALSRFGFTAEDLQEGWDLLTRLTHGRLEAAPPADTTLVAEIDAWENTWLPVAKATLESKAPAAASMVFTNLAQTQGPGVVVSVGTFVERVERLDSAVSEGGLGRAGKSAQQLLAKRGLTDAELGRAKAMLARVSSIDVTPPRPAPDASEPAERALWAWYLEWSGIARVAIQDRATLRRLGFTKRGRPAKADMPTPTPSATPPS